MNTCKNFELVLFGATGDLVLRKLLPAMYTAFKYKTIHPYGRIIALGRRNFSKSDYMAFVYENFAANKFIVEPELWERFTHCNEYIQIEASNEQDFKKLTKLLNHTLINIYYLSTSPNLFSIICTNLALNNLNHINSRIVLEKPIGNNYNTSHMINEHVRKFFLDKQIFRIDHYLGKESVQNIIAIRFANPIFEAFWNRQWISSIQISITEKIGVAKRGEFYNQVGALRDMLQNHLIQLLCIVAMEPPISTDSDIIRQEKLKVIQSLKSFDINNLDKSVVMGQYTEGTVDYNKVCGYLSEEHIPSNSITETFVAIKTEIENWRWAGVPFYLRTGKRLEKNTAEIVIFFKELPLSIFPNQKSKFSNRLIIKLQPEYEIKIYNLSKEPVDQNNLKSVFLDLDFATKYNKRRMDGYERLLIEIIKGKLELFVSHEEQSAAWKWVEPIITANIKPELYSAGSRGPKGSNSILDHDNLWLENIL